MSPTAAPDSRSDSTTRLLLRFGALAGPFYLAIGLMQALTREGFDVRRHALSHLSNGELGWTQVANFIFSGAFVLLGAFGVHRAIAGSRGGRWGPILFGTFGAGMIAAGLFRADPAPDFPLGPGVVAAEMTRAGLLHFVAGAIGFYAMIAACFVFVRRFREQSERVWAFVSALTGVVFFAAFAAIASGPPSAAAMIAFYAAVAWLFTWHAAIHIRLAR